MNNPILNKDIVFNESHRSKKAKCENANMSSTPAFPPLTAEEQSQLYNNLSIWQTQHGKVIKLSRLIKWSLHSRKPLPVGCQISLFCIAFGTLYGCNPFATPWFIFWDPIKSPPLNLSPLVMTSRGTTAVYHRKILWCVTSESGGLYCNISF